MADIAQRIKLNPQGTCLSNVYKELFRKERISSNNAIDKSGLYINQAIQRDTSNGMRDIFVHVCQDFGTRKPTLASSFGNGNI